MSLVSELQQEALNEKVSVSALLRKALLVANKLDLKSFTEWIEKELNGYGEMKDVPPYRMVTGITHVFNPYRGTYQLLHFNDPKADERYSRMNFHLPLSEIEHLAAGAKSGDSIIASYPPKMEQRLMNAMRYRMQPSLHIQPSQFRRILDAVRTAVLKWAIELEQKGISGDGLSFSKKEKVAASRSTVHIENYIESMHQSQIQRDVQGSVQTLTVKELDLEAVGKFVAELEQILQGSTLPAEQLAELQADVATIRAQLASPKPKPSLIREGLASVRHVLEHAGGKIAATGILAALSTLVGP